MCCSDKDHARACSTSGNTLPVCPECAEYFQVGGTRSSLWHRQVHVLLWHRSFFSLSGHRVSLVWKCWKNVASVARVKRTYRERQCGCIAEEQVYASIRDYQRVRRSGTVEGKLCPALWVPSNDRHAGRDRKLVEGGLVGDTKSPRGLAMRNQTVAPTADTCETCEPSQAV